MVSRQTLLPNSCGKWCALGQRGRVRRLLGRRTWARELQEGAGHPPPSLPPNSCLHYYRIIMSSPSPEDEKVSFEDHPDANPKSREKGLKRFQMNPEPNWGPKNRWELVKCNLGCHMITQVKDQSAHQLWELQEDQESRKKEENHGWGRSSF